MHKLLEAPRRNFARARLTISLAPLVALKGVILVFTSVWSVASIEKSPKAESFFIGLQYSRRSSIRSRDDTEIAASA